MPNPNEAAPTLPLRKRRGNPLGNPGLNLSPRCGARTRAGCPCRGPAVHGGLRCRMHGGRSTGPRTEAGLARSRTARLTHGGYSEEARAQARYRITLLRRTGLLLEVMRCLEQLPAALASRVLEAPELALPPRPTRGLSEKEDREVRRQEAAAALPWREAVKAARGRKLLGNKGEAHVPVSSGLLPLPLSPAREGRGDVGADAGDGPHAPVGNGAHRSGQHAASAFIGGQSRASACPLPLPKHTDRGQNSMDRENGDGAKRNSDGPRAPVSGPPPGLTRKERKRWKWEQRKLRKAGGG